MKIIILGAGLSGLTLAYFLRNSDVEVKIIEARSRVGGRIHTIYYNETHPVEMGATWLGKKHKHLVSLIEDLGISIFPQFLGEKAIFESISTSPPSLVTLPENDEPSFRIDGGSSSIIQKLVNSLNEDQLFFNERVLSVKFESNANSVITNKSQYAADIIISTLPPNLLIKNVQFTPEIPIAYKEVAVNTHTWMGESIKVALLFSDPFWRSGSSGTIFSNVGPISELYDHSNYDDTQYALMGFMNGGFFELSGTKRKDYVLNQLYKYFGDSVKDHLDYLDCAWRNEEYTFTPYSSNILPHQNNGHTIYKTPLFDNRLYIAGSETASSFPGYMDGAVESANFVFQKIKEL